MLRNRDIAAVILALILTRMAWNDNIESLSASVHLAFYFPRDRSPAVAPLDVDGDGTSEALAIIKASSKSSKTSWVLQIMDLKPLHQFGKTYLAPFQPNVLFTSNEINEDGAVPLKITTGQVLVKQTKAVEPKKMTPIVDSNEYDERTRHYFCGSDWHDAASKCGTPCPSGSGNDCPGGESCYADTPCDALAPKSDREDTQVLFHLTPGGGLPSVITLWSNGVLSLTSLTADKPLEVEADSEKQNRKALEKNQKLELRQMWRVQLLPNTNSSDAIVWEESNIRFLDAYDSDPAIAHHGMVVVSGSYAVNEEEEAYPFILAVDAMTGGLLWDSFSDEQRNGVQDLPFPVHRGTSSFARRRSRIPSLRERSLSAMGGATSLPNCMVAFKHSLRAALPYAYWGPHDADLQAIHLEKKTRNKDKSQDHNAAKNHGHENGHEHHKALEPHRNKKWHHKFHKSKQQKVIFGRPNVLVTHSHGGVEIRSLVNGRPLCHLSLLEETLYADLNNDGILDQVQVILENNSKYTKDPWTRRIVRDILQQAQRSREEQKERGGKVPPSSSSPTICHALGFSGMPAKEELFSSTLCGNAHERVGKHPAVSIDSVPPIIVEALYGRRGSRDVIVALNNGMIHRLQGTTGRREWQVSGNHHDDFPTWEANSNRNALLTRVQSHRIAPSVRPILLAGENGLAVISVKNGNVLASSSFPQTSVGRPVLAEVSGDGTTDVMILSADAIWGYQIVVTPGSSIMMRIMVGLLLMGLMLAVLRNRFGQQKDKRSTDE